MNETSTEGHSLTARAAWLLTARTLAFVLSFALPLLLVRRLSQHDFGLYKQVFLIVGTAIMILPIGFGMSAYYFLPRERQRRGEIVFNILLFYAVTGGLACFALFLYPTLLATVFNSPELIDHAPTVGLVALLWMLSALLETLVIANQEARLATIFIITSQLTKALLLLTAAVAFGSVRSLIFAAIVQGALQTIVLLVYLRSRFGSFWQTFRWPLMGKQLAYALPLGFAGLIYTMQMDLHNYFVSHRFGAGAFAIYSIGCLQLPLVAILSEAVGSVMIPRVSYLQSLDRSQEIIELIARMIRKLAAAYFPLFVFLLVAGREFIVALFTTRYLDSWPIFAVNLVLIPLALVATACDPVQRAYAEHRYFWLYMRIALLSVLLVALWYSTKYFGLLGTIIVVVSMNSVERLITAVKSGKILGVARSDLALLRDTGRLAVAAGAAGLVTALTRLFLSQTRPFVALVVCGIIFSLSYVAAVLLLGIPTPDERNAIWHQMRRFRWAVWKRPAASLAD